MPKHVSRKEFDVACAALWTEFEYQNILSRRTEDEATNPAAFATLGRRYIRKLEDHWADSPGVTQPDGQIQVSECLHILRKLTAIFMRGMIYSGIRDREQ